MQQFSPPNTPWKDLQQTHRTQKERARGTTAPALSGRTKAPLFAKWCTFWRKKVAKLGVALLSEDNSPEVGDSRQGESQVKFVQAQQVRLQPCCGTLEVSVSLATQARWCWR